MLDRNDDRTITANVDEVLTALRANLAEHNEILAEARTGYVEKCKVAVIKAQERLNKRLRQLDDGKAIQMESIHFSLAPPQDHFKEFATVIKMLELHQNAHNSQPGGTDCAGQATIELKAIDVQRYVLNDWSWMDNFLLSNSSYSGKSRALAASKGLI